jgi:hypothetical protein
MRAFFGPRVARRPSRFGFTQRSTGQSGTRASSSPLLTVSRLECVDGFPLVLDRWPIWREIVQPFLRTGIELRKQVGGVERESDTCLPLFIDTAGIARAPELAPR